MLFLEFVNELTGTYVAYYLAIYSYITGTQNTWVIWSEPTNPVHFMEIDEFLQKNLTIKY